MNGDGQDRGIHDTVRIVDFDQLESFRFVVLQLHAVVVREVVILGIIEGAEGFRNDVLEDGAVPVRAIVAVDQADAHRI